ncbi:DUF664 domain-containing protein [Actinomadura sp. NPDC047616]|uniref:mycothiol transferase n=1 Tax=Actinomadura sp. NPDC047616 TaxID=3155914 RepID=UPI0033DA4E79
MSRTTRRNRRGDTPPPRTGSSETEVLRGFLDYLRTSIAAKVDGAPEPQVRTAAVPSGTNLLGLLNHLTFVERSIFLGDDVTDWQATFQAAPADSAAEVVARYRETVERANDVLDGCTDLGAPVPRKHVLAIEGAKKPETRIQRIEKALAMLRDGEERPAARAKTRPTRDES